jgi:uncharacterized membrane protein
MSVKVFNLTRSALIASAYFLLALPFGQFNFGICQFRVAEVLTVLPIFNAGAIAGLTVGCVLTNILGVATGVNPGCDIFIGSIATFVAAFITRKLRNKQLCGLPVLSCLAPVLINAVIIGVELTFVELGWSWNWAVLLKNALQVGIGELIPCVVLGLPFYKLLVKNNFLYRN